jgi:hypothetical protein
MVATSHPDRASDAGSDTEVLECQVCGFPVDPERGLLAADVAIARAAQNSYSYPAEWLPLHVECSGRASFYTIELADLHTPARVLWWSGHLLTKSWVASTNWLEVMRRAGGHR